MRSYFFLIIVILNSLFLNKTSAHSTEKEYEHFKEQWGMACNQILNQPLNSSPAVGLPTVSVTQFGAVGDGSTDDFQAIVNAMNDAQGIGPVFFPPGTYAISQSLPLPDYIVLIGENKAYCTIKAMGNFPVIQETRTSSDPIHWAGIVNLTIRGGGMNGSNAHGIQLKFGNRVTLSNLFIFSCNHGIDLAHQYQTFMTDVHVHGAGSDQSNIGFYFQPLTDPSDENNAVQAVNCLAQGIASYGFRLINSNGSKFINCEAQNGIYGFYIGDPPTNQRKVRWSHFANCLADTNSQAGWYLQRGLSSYMGEMQFSNCWGGNCPGSLLNVNGCSNMSFSNFLLVSAGQNGAVFSGCNNLSVTGFTIQDYNNVSSGFAGINILNSNKCAVTSTNTQTNFNMRGIDLNGTSDYNAITGNVVQGGVGNFSRGTHNVIANNVTY